MSRNGMLPGERTLFELRTHGKVTVPAFAGLAGGIVLSASANWWFALLMSKVGKTTFSLAGTPFASMPGWVTPTLVVGAICLIWWLMAGLPQLWRWRFTCYTITNQRVLSRTGLIRIRRHDLPLSKVSNVEMAQGVLDHIFRCGTIELKTSAADPVYLVDVPEVDQVRAKLMRFVDERSNVREPAEHE